jgi:SAM-dependent methyltransferase
VADLLLARAISVRGRGTGDFRAMAVDVLPLSEACERNKGPILEVLTGLLAGHAKVLEIGSGTGQHAMHFARNLPHIRWQPTDTGEYLPLLRERLQRERLDNMNEVLELDVRRRPWPVESVDAVFTANTLHIMEWSAVEQFFTGVGALLDPAGAARDALPGVLCVYGPFRYGGRFTSDSNAAFDRFLKERDARSGIRDFEALDALACRQGLQLAADHPMPAHNQTLIWRHASCEVPTR